jgi:four helix bundle protein
MKDNLIVSKSKKFAIRIIRLYQYLLSEKKEYILSKQLLRSGTSIGANIKEAIQGQSKKKFLHQNCRYRSKKQANLNTGLNCYTRLIT